MYHRDNHIQYMYLQSTVLSRKVRASYAKVNRRRELRVIYSLVARRADLLLHASVAHAGSRVGQAACTSPLHVREVQRRRHLPARYARCSTLMPRHSFHFVSNILVVVFRFMVGACKR